MQTKLNNKTYPYSLNYLFTCLKRCIERTDHKTMPNDPYLVAKIVVKFYDMMSHFSPKSLYKKYEGKVNLRQYLDQTLVKMTEFFASYVKGKSSTFKLP